MKKPTLSVLLISAFIATAAQAACDPKSENLFACTVKKSGKRVEVCATATAIQYSFGKPKAKPELALSVPKNQASTYQWEGFGRVMAYSVNLPNGEVEYRVYAGSEKATEENPDGTSFAGVHVVKNGQQIAEIQCVDGTVTAALEGLKLRRAEEW
ncbi:hypothetical protein [Methylomagnum sp.]